MRTNERDWGKGRVNLRPHPLPFFFVPPFTSHHSLLSELGTDLGNEHPRSSLGETPDPSELLTDLILIQYSYLFFSVSVKNKVGVRDVLPPKPPR